MKIDDVMKLINAGFTKEEIISMTGETEVEPAAAKPEEPAAPEKPAEPAAPEFKSVLDDFLKGFKSIAEDIKQSNIANSNMPAQEKTSAEQILASIIAPPKKGE